MPSPTLPPASLFETAALDWAGLGSMSCIVGAVLLANSILFRHPRRLVEEYFAGRPKRLHSIHDYIFNRVQVHVGFLFLVAGFAAQLFAHYQPAPSEPPRFPLIGVCLLLVVVVALEALGWWWSKRLFRKYVRRYLAQHPLDFETDTRLAREVGDLFDVQSAAEDTVQSYVARLRLELGLPAPGRVPPAAREKLTELADDE
ncbi:MAG: hypothetical protein EPO68_00750 [Planctomycetota bacterium]|nr:MAG: hypothetical protein EPO68_00750 [Planctomycetota bacterium]